MKNGNLVKAALGFLCMLVLILDGSTAVAGVQRGIDLCIRTIIPALFPFSVASLLLTATMVGRKLSILRPIGKLCGIPEGSESLLLIGWIGGYPVGAQNVVSAYMRGQLSREDAVRMAIFCNNAGPAFLFGVLLPIIGDWKLLWLMWILQITGSVLTGMLIPGGQAGSVPISTHETVSVSGAIRQAASAMGNVCACVVLFRMILEFLNRWIFWTLPAPWQAAVSGILELSNGCILLNDVSSSNMRFILAGAMLSFGGICVWMQTASLCSAISGGRYILWKAVQCTLTTLLCISVLAPKGIRYLLIVAILFLPLMERYLFRGKRKKDIALSNPLLYNEKSAIL